MDAAKQLGALNYVGNDEYSAGLGGGEYFGANGAKNVLCVNTLPGAANIEARCKGIADGITKSGGKSTAAAAAVLPVRQPDRCRRGDQGRAAEGRDHRRRHHHQRRRRRQRRQRHQQARRRRQGQAWLVRHGPDRPRPHQGRHAAVRDRPAALPAGLLSRSPCSRLVRQLRHRPADQAGADRPRRSSTPSNVDATMAGARPAPARPLAPGAGAPACRRPGLRHSTPAAPGRRRARTPRIETSP